MKRLLLFAMAIVFAMQLSAQQVIVVGDTNTSSTSSYVPGNLYYKKSFTESIYPAASLAPGMITKLSYYHNGGNFTNGQLTIYMKEVFNTTMTSFDVAEGFQEVFSGPVNFPTGRSDFELTTPFIYTGTGNLLIAVIREGSSYENYHTFKTLSGSSVYTYSDNVSYNISQSPSNYPSTSNMIPVIRIEISAIEGYCYPPSEVAVSEIETNSATISWSMSNENVSNFGLAYKKAIDTEWISVDENIIDTSYTLTNLDTYTNYDFKVWSICEESNSAEITGRFLTLPSEDNYLVLPYSQNFDELTHLSEWELWNVDNIGENKWYLGEVGSNPSSEGSVNGLYISSDNGGSNSYTHTASVAHLSTLINIEEDNYYGLEFDFKQKGELGWDEIAVSLLPLGVEIPQTNTNLRNSPYLIGQTYTTSDEWTRYFLQLPINITPSVYQLVISWKNDEAGGESPAGAIDNINIFSTTCAKVNDFDISFEDAGNGVNMNITVNDSLNEAAEYLVEYRYEGDTLWYNAISESPITLADLPYSSKVDFTVTAICDGNQEALSSSMHSVWTLCSAVSDFPYIEDFEESTVIAVQDTLKSNLPAVNCWYNIQGGEDGYYWSSISTEQGINSTDALRFYGSTYSSEADFDEWLISPMFTLSGNERLNFYYKPTYASNPPVIDVLIFNASENDYSTMADTANFTLLASINSQSLAVNQYHPVEVLLNQYSGNVRLALAVRQKSSSFFIDDFKVSAVPSCPDLLGLSAVAGDGLAYISYNTGNVTEAGVVLAYSELASGEEFDLTTATTITIPATETLPYVVEGLVAGSTYAFAAQQACGGEWSDVVTITLPNAYSMPLLIDFDTPQTTPEMELVTDGLTNAWFIGTAANNTVNAEGNLTSGGALYISSDNGATTSYLNTSATNATASILVSITPGQETRLSFDYKVGGESGWDYLSVYMIPFGAEFSDAYRILYDLSETFTWQTAEIALPSTYFGLYNLVFRWWNDNMYGSQPAAVIDNISMSQTTCVSTAVEWAVAPSQTQEGEMSLVVNLTDESNVGATYTISYRESEETSFTQLTGLTISDFPYTITEGIDFQTSYEIQLSLLCSGEETALELGSQTITTPCETIQLPWYEDFSTNPYNTICWQKYYGEMPSNGIMNIANLYTTTSSYAWGYAEDFQCGTTTSNMLRAELYSTNKYWAISPTVNLGNDVTSPKQIAFDLGLRAYGSNIAPTTAAPDDRVMMLVSLDNGTTWNILNGLVFSDSDADTVHNYSDLTPQMQRYAYKLVDANNVPLTGGVKFAFYSESTLHNADNFACLDNISVEDWSECQAPYNVEVSSANITSNSATATFQTFGTATSWEYVLVAGESNNFESQTPISLSVAEPIALTGLTPATTYTFAIRSVCTTNSPWISVVFTTLEAAVAVPYQTTFDNESWSVNNGSATENSWVIGEEIGNQAPAAYISNDGTIYAATLATTSTISHIWKDFNFATTEENFELSFDWKASGAYNAEGSIIGGIAVYLVEPTPLPETGLLNSDNLLTVLTTSDQWQNERVYLGNVTGEKRLVFTAFGYTTDSQLTTPAAIDNVSLSISECAQVENVIISNQTSSSIDVSWTATEADSYIVTYSKYGVEAAEEMTTTVTEPFVTLTELESITTYTISVIAVCAGNEAVASTQVLASTIQEAVELPYYCDFESEGTNGWLLKNGNLVNKWYVGNPTGETGNKLFVSNNGTSANYSISSTSVVVAEKLFQLGATDSIVVSFDLKVGGESTYDYLKVFWLPADMVFDPYIDASFALKNYGTNVIMSNAASSSDYFVNLILTTQNMSVVLPNNHNELRKLVFVWKNDGSDGSGQSVVIDNISVEPVGEETTCIRPIANSVEASNITGSSATISWVDNDQTHTSWNVYYRAAGQEDYSVVAATTTSVVLTDLNAATTYSVYVTTDCGEDESAPTDIISFITPCEVISTFPYFDSFEAGLGCWVASSITGTELWRTESGMNSYDMATGEISIQPVDGELLLYHTWSEGVSSIVASPIFDIASLESPYLKLNYALGAYVTTSESLTVKYRTNADESWTTLITYNSPIAQWTLDSIALPNPSSTYQIAFESLGVFGYGVGVDAITIYDAAGEQGGTDPDPEPQPCDAPTALSANNITETTAEITWTGTAEAYEFKLNSGAAETLTTTTKSLTDLTPNTTYTVEVRAVCGEQTSDWVSTTFTTLEQIVIVLAEVTTTPATEVGNTSATLNGALVNAGNSENIAVGFALATVADFTLETADVQNITATLSDATFSQVVTDLVEGQTYFYRAYATNEVGTAYGAVETFTLSGLTDALANALTATIYPNPASDKATLRVEGLQSDAKIVISDLQGRILSQGEIKANEKTYTINASELSSGVYYIRIVADSVVSTQKLIVE